MKIKEITAIASKQLGLDEQFVYKVYMGYWKSMRSILSDIPLKECSSNPEEYLKSIRSSVNIPYIGKLYVPLVKMKSYLKNKKYEYKEDKADV